MNAMRNIRQILEVKSDAEHKSVSIESEKIKSEEECKRIIIKLAIKHGVSPALVATRLLSEEDKNDMRNGDLPIEALDVAIECWKEIGMPDQTR